MFIIELTYTADLARIDAAMPAHMKWLRAHYASGHFIVSGRKIPRDGGIILAAGKSTRMKSRLPKTLHNVCGRPLLHYVIQACYDAGVSKIILVVGHGKDEVIAAFGDDKRITFVEQTEQLGTGHAARVCEAELKKMHGGDVLRSVVIL